MITLKLKKNNIPNLKHRIKELSKQKLSYGYYESQGYHDTQVPNAKPIKYVDLIRIHEGGSVKNNLPARPVLSISAFLFKPSRQFKNILKKYFSNIDRKTPPIKAQFVYESLGKELVAYGRTIFGNKQHLYPLADTTIAYKESVGATYTSDPLLAWGDLRANLSYSINGVVVTPS